MRISTRRHVQPRAEGLLLGAAAGALFGVSDVALKWLTQAEPGPLLGLLSPWTLTALIAGVISFYASARSLQIGEGVEVIAITSVAANLAAILGGIIVFHEPIGSGPFEITARFLAFCLVIAGAALMPAPMRAAPEAGRGRGLRPVAPSTLDEGVVQDRLVVVLPSDHDDLVPGSRVHDSLAVDLGSKALGVDGGERVTRAVHAPPPVAASDYGDELAGLPVVVGCDELDQRLLGDPALRKATTYFRSRPHLFLRTVSPSPICTAPSPRVVPMNTR